MADAEVSKTFGATRVSSTLTSGTIEHNDDICVISACIIYKKKRL